MYIHNSLILTFLTLLSVYLKFHHIMWNIVSLLKTLFLMMFKFIVHLI